MDPFLLKPSAVENLSPLEIRSVPRNYLNIAARPTSICICISPLNFYLRLEGVCGSREYLRCVRGLRWPDNLGCNRYAPAGPSATINPPTDLAAAPPSSSLIKRCSRSDGAILQSRLGRRGLPLALLGVVWETRVFWGARSQPGGKSGYSLILAFGDGSDGKTGNSVS